MEGLLTVAPPALHLRRRDTRAKGRMVWALSWELGTEACSPLPDTLPSSVSCVRNSANEVTAVSGNLCQTAATVVLPAQDWSFHWSLNHFKSHCLHLPSDPGCCVTQLSRISRQDGQKFDVSTGTFLFSGNVSAAGSSQEARTPKLLLGPTNGNIP